MTRSITVGIVGAGWRAEFFARIATALPERFALVGVAARRPDAAEQFAARFGTRAYTSPADLLAAQRPDLVVSSIAPDASAEITAQLVADGARVLTETPPATDVADLRRLWQRVGAADAVQVAEQYALLPSHAARLAVVRSGVLGDISSVHVSSTHGYHAVSLMRAYLGIDGGEPVTVRSSAHPLTLVDTLTRDGWTDDPTARAASNILSLVDFGGRLGVYDFTDNQWHNRLRFRRILVRGSRGELSNDEVVHAVDERTILTSRIERTQLGHDLNLDGHDTELLAFEGSPVYRNPYLGARFMDEEIGMASVMEAAGVWAQGEGPGPYSLARASQDQLISLAIQQSLDRGGEAVTTGIEAWAR